MDRTPSTFLGTRQSEKVDRAFRTAKAAHSGQRRKGGGSFFLHPLRVARQVAKVPHTTEMVCAALLHDVVEDTAVTIDQIRKEFGLTVARLVEALTCRLTSEDGNRATRKRMERERLASAGPEVGTVKLADVMDNVRDIAVIDPGFAKVYLPEQLALARALETADHDLRDQAIELIEREMDKLDAVNELASCS